MAQLAKCPISAQVMISQFVSSSPMLCSVLTAQNLEPTSDSVSPSLSAPSLFALCLSLAKINKLKKHKIQDWCCLSLFLKLSHKLIAYSSSNWTTLHYPMEYRGQEKPCENEAYAVYCALGPHAPSAGSHEGVAG